MGEVDDGMPTTTAELVRSTEGNNKVVAIGAMSQSNRQRNESLMLLYAYYRMGICRCIARWGAELEERDVLWTRCRALKFESPLTYGLTKPARPDFLQPASIDTCTHREVDSLVTQ